MFAFLVSGSEIIERPIRSLIADDSIVKITKLLERVGAQKFLAKHPILLEILTSIGAALGAIVYEASANIRALVKQLKDLYKKNIIQ